MHVITRKRLNEFAKNFPESAIALAHWYRTIKQTNFLNFEEVKTQLTVFNIGGNRVRLIAAIHYNRRNVYVRAVLTHTEYNLGKWKK